MNALYNFNNRVLKIAENGGGLECGFASKTICPPASKLDTASTKFELKLKKDKKSEKNFSGFFAFFRKLIKIKKDANNAFNKKSTI